MKKLEITYRNLCGVPNEIILGIYNGLYPNEPIVSALALTDPEEAKLFKETITPYTHDSIIALKKQYAQEMKNKFASYLQKGNHSVDAIKKKKQKLYAEYTNNIKKLEKTISASINFYHNLGQLYNSSIVDELVAGKPFELSRPNNTTDRFLVTNGNLIYVNEGITGARSGFLYTEYDCQEIIDNLINQMYEENNIELLTRNITQEENTQ